jgi:hypothetical protein
LGQFPLTHSRLAGSVALNSDAAGIFGQTQSAGIAAICADRKSMKWGGLWADAPYRNPLVSGHCLRLAAVPEKGPTADKGLGKLLKNAVIQASRWRKPTGVL